MKSVNNYFLGLDIGTDSVGYAVADDNYSLLRHKGEPMWGVHLFDEALIGDERRTFRTSRRRLDRRQQRVRLLDEIFACEIGKIDPKFFIRKKESALCREDAGEPFSIFNEAGFTDKEYYNKYPTIHHLIWDLIENKGPHDVRLVYIALAWLVAHRGHFLNEVSKENIKEVLDINQVYSSFYNFFAVEKPWGDVDVQGFGNILKKKIGVGAKYKELCLFLYNESKASSDITEEFCYSREGILKLLCGGEYAAKKLFGKEEYSSLPSLNMNMKDEDFDNVLNSLGDDGEIVAYIKALYDWTILSDILSEGEYISKAKIGVYEQHKKDLKTLKYFVRRYAPERYNEVFRIADTKISNYSSYSGNFKASDSREAQKKTNKEDFCKYISSVFKDVLVAVEDEETFSDMKKRLELRTFMPKQVDSDNRVLPYQIYWIELNQILKNASNYLPFLNEDKDGYTAIQKILAVFEFRVPYFVGPLNRHSVNSWFVRAAEGRILPWNFSEVVDLDSSEQAFIDRMTNRCTYLPNCNVISKCSLIYQKFMVLNEINCITVSGNRLSVPLKQKIYKELFLKKKKVTIKAIKDLLVSTGEYTKADIEDFGGVDLTIKSSLSSHIAFNNLYESKQLSENDIEKIIERSTYSESKTRFALWLNKNYPFISSVDKKYICSLKFKDFGRLSREFLCNIQGADKKTSEAHSIIEWMWETNQNLNELLSEKYSFREEIESIQNEYYDVNKKTVSERLDEMYVSGSVKRSIIRTLDIVSDVVKVCGKAPDKIFIEMARGTVEDQKGKRTQTRFKQLKAFYSKIDSEDVRELERSLDSLGEFADNKLQSEKLYLYYLQLGKCMYSGEPIELSALSSKLYDVDHIYPQAKVKDDSLNNKVLVLSAINGEKKDEFPIKSEIRHKMQGFWKMLLDNKLISDEKYKRLTRHTTFSEDEEWGFINRQLVETRQSTKAVATLLCEKYKDTEIVYVKAGKVSEFRQKFDILKCRSVNDLHHAKDAFLNIVVGNVHHECFTKNWFLSNRNNYSIKTETLFGKKQVRNEKIIWNGGPHLDKVKKTVMSNNCVHFTKYAFCRFGGFFDQMPLKAASGLIPRKAGLETEKYGGYNKSSASFFSLVKYKSGKKSDMWIMPVDLLISEKFLSDNAFAKEYAIKQLSAIKASKIDSVEFPLGSRVFKINTIFDFDGMRMCLSNKDSGGKNIGWTLIKPLVIGYEWEKYIKRLERFVEKEKENVNLKYFEEYDKISKEENLTLYDILTDKLKSKAYCKRQASPIEAIEKGRDKFISCNIESQCKCLLQMVAIFGRLSSGCDLTYIDAAKKSATNRTSAFVSNWKKAFSDVRIIDSSASGLYESKSENLLNLL